MVRCPQPAGADWVRVSPHDPGRGTGHSHRCSHNRNRDRDRCTTIMDDILKLVELAQQGDRQAYGELVHRCQPIVYAKALARLRNPLEAQELAQEVFIHAWTKLGQLRDLKCFIGWLCQITVRMAINRVTRRLPLQGAEPEILQNTAAVGDTPLDELVRKEQTAELWVGLKQLKAIDRETLVAFYIQGRSLKQMSRQFET